MKHTKATAGWLAVVAVSLSTIFAGPVWGQSLTVRTTTELQNAVAAANSAGGGRTILLEDGTYTLSGTIYVNAPDVVIAGASGDRARVIIQGDAMSASAKVKGLIRVAARNFTLRDLTLQKAGTHLLQIAGETNADGAIVRNVIFRDAWEQLLKVSIDPANMSVTGDNGIIENSLFEYTAGVGPQYYIGGIDVHGGKNWIVRGNTFRAIASPNSEVAEFAIHFWNQSANPLVERNVIVNCDRGIGFGLDNRGNSGGIIRNNMIYHAATGTAQDTGIYLDQSPNTQVYNNTVFMENSYPRAIEYRFAQTTNVLIANNLTNKPIGARDGATGSVTANVVTASRSWFVAPTTGDLHLASAIDTVVDKGQAISGLVDDIDGAARPNGAGIDIGADEYGIRRVAPMPPTNLRVE